MAKLLRLWEKKRGDRRTGSRLLGGLGEGLFFAGLFFLGGVSLAATIASHVTRTGPAAQTSGWGFWLLVLVLSSFVLIGVGGFVLTMLHFGASAERRSALTRRASRIEILPPANGAAPYPNIPRDDNLTNSPGVRLAFRLPSEHTPFWRLSAALLSSLVWNGITAVLIVLAVRSFRAGQPEWFLTFVAVAFVLVGLGTIYFFVRQLALLTGIGPTSVEISDHPFRPGGSYRVFISQTGRLKMRVLELLLVCEEEATYHQGTDVRTDVARVFSQQMVCERNFTISPGSPWERECQIEVPAGAMHSFKANCNAIQWKLVVRGHSRGWPRFERSFPVVVYPPSDVPENV